MPTVDNLDIEISASVSKANASLDLLVKRLGKVSASLSGVNTRGIATMASGVNKLANAMNNFSNNTNTAVFTRLTKNLNSLGNIDQNAIANASKSLGKIAGAMKVFNNIDITDNAKKLGELAKGISQLGYSSATKAIDNIPKLATAMRNLMQTLSTAPKVSQNLIDMTNALAKLARTGASSGRAANSLSKSLDNFSKSTIGARRSSLSLAGAIGKVYATYWLLFRAFGKIGEAINIASGLQEVQNVIDVTFGDFKQKVEDLAKVSITDFGMSELTAKQIAGRFQAMGTAMGIAQGKMSDMSIELTKLSADMASFYNVAQEDVARSLQSVFTGEAEPLRKYGVDLTQATLKTFALSQGLDSNVEAMTQAEKSMLRYQYVMHATGAAQGDFARTNNNWANQIRILKGNFEELASIIGGSFINALKPMVKAINSAMRAIINFAKVVSESLGKIFGWQYEDTSGGITADMEGASDYAEDTASGIGKAADNAKKLKQQLQGIDELNVLTSPSDTGGSGGSGGGGGGTATESGDVGGWTKTDGILKDYESQLDTLYKLGEAISEKLTKAMNSIDWNSVYQSAKNFGSGFASFLNGLISPELFGATGKTIAGALNTAIYTALSFGEEFDFYDFGLSIITGINEFFDTFDFGALARTINVWVHGLEEALITAIANFDIKKVLEGLNDFLTEIDLDVVALAIGAFLWKYKGSQIALSALSSLLSAEIAVGIGSLSTTVGVALGLSIVTAVVGFKIGNTLYDKVPTVQQMSDSLVELFGGIFTSEYKLKDFIHVSFDVSADIMANLINLFMPDGKKIDATKMKSNDVWKQIFNYLFGDQQEKKNAGNFFLGFKLYLEGNIEKTKQDLQKKWDSVKKSWGSKTLGISSYVQSFKDSAYAKWVEVRDWWKRNKNVTRLAIGVTAPNFYESVKTMWNKFIKWWNTNNKLKFEFDAQTLAREIAGIINSKIIGPINTKIISSLNSLLPIKKKIPLIPYISTYATGGFPEEGPFYMNRGEIAGKFSNGKGVVANNMQITRGISDAVQQGNQQMIAYMQQEILEMRKQNEYLKQILDKETGISYKDVGKANEKYTREKSSMNGTYSFA